jgi:hypothetical protein
MIELRPCPRCEELARERDEARAALAEKAKDRFDNFGRLVWYTIEKHYAAAEMTEGDEEYMELALKCGLCTRESYDREKHGYVNDAEPGDLIYVRGER